MKSAQQLVNALELGGSRMPLVFVRLVAAGNSGQLFRDGGRRQHEIGRRCGGARHHVELRALGILRERDSARVANGLQSERTVCVIARKHHADRVALLVLRQRAEEEVERTMRHLRRARRQKESAVADRHLRIGRNHVDLVLLDGHPIGHLLYRNRGRAGEDVDEQAGMMRIEVLDDHEGQPRIHRQRGDEIAEGVQAARGGTDGDDAHHRDAGRSGVCAVGVARSHGHRSHPFRIPV
jgi:hypothetical protein